jgi:hypothetical protein
MLFGLEHASRIVDIPSGLGRFVQATGGLLGTAEEVIRSRTVAAAYWPFASESIRLQLVLAATDAAGVNIPMVLGLQAGRVRALHPLRSCPACRSEAVETVGYATWRLSDQLPGVWWCSQHKRPMEQVNNARDGWRKPGMEGVTLRRPANPREEHSLEMMRSLADAIATSPRINSWALASAVVDRLVRLGVATSPAKLNAKRLHSWLESAPLVTWMHRWAGCIAVPPSSWAVPLIRGRSRPHPLRWMMLWAAAWQDETVEQAVTDFNSAAQGQSIKVHGTQFLLWPQDWSSSSESVLPAEVEDAFLASSTIQDVAHALGTDTSAVRDWMTDRPYFAKTWLKRVRDRRLHQAREQLLHVLANRPEISPDEFLRVCASDVEWLSWNAPLILRSLMNRLPKRAGAQMELF